MSNINELVLEMMLTPGMLTKPGQSINLMSRPSKMQMPGQQGNWLNFQTKPGTVEQYTKNSNVRMRALNGIIPNRSFVPTASNDPNSKPNAVRWGTSNQIGSWRTQSPNI